MKLESQDLGATPLNLDYEGYIIVVNMAETVETPKLSEIGEGSYKALASVLKDRETHKYNVVQWGGSVNELEAQVSKGSLYPAATFAVVCEGISRYKLSKPSSTENTDSMRKLAEALSDGSEVYRQASQVDEEAVKKQIKTYVEGHGGVFDSNINWQDFIKERAEKLKTKAEAIDAANR